MVIALGGNAIKQWNEKGSAEEQLENLIRSCFHSFGLRFTLKSLFTSLILPMFGSLIQSHFPS
jgi:hypothetical protein